jgi:hypothetical protein
LRHDQEVMMRSRSWLWWVPAVLTVTLWLTACEPQRPEVLEETNIEEADTDRAPPAVEPVVTDEEREEAGVHDEHSADHPQ